MARERGRAKRRGMKISLAISALLVASAYARVGEPMKVFMERASKAGWYVIDADKPTARRTSVAMRKGDIAMEAIALNGIISEETYSGVTPEQAAEIMKLQSAKEWKLVRETPKMKIWSDGTLRAALGGTILVVGDDKASKDAERPKLEGL